MLEIRQTNEFSKWLKRLKDTNAKARINVRIRRLEITGNFGDAKSVGNGISELRIDYGPGVSRVFYAKRKRDYLAAYWRKQINAAKRYRTSESTEQGI